MVVGGWQEARGGAIGPKYTDKRLNNSYFVENILEELDSPGEWFMDADALWLYVGTAPTAAGAGAGAGAADADASATGNRGPTGYLVASQNASVIYVLGNSPDDPVRSWQRQQSRSACLLVLPCLLYTSPSPRDRG